MVATHNDQESKSKNPSRNIKGNQYNVGAITSGIKRTDEKASYPTNQKYDLAYFYCQWQTKHTAECAYLECVAIQTLLSPIRMRCTKMNFCMMVQISLFLIQCAAQN